MNITLKLYENHMQIIGHHKKSNANRRQILRRSYQLYNYGCNPNRRLSLLLQLLFILFDAKACLQHPWAKTNRKPLNNRNLTQLFKNNFRLNPFNEIKTRPYNFNKNHWQRIRYLGDKFANRLFPKWKKLRVLQF